MEEQGLSAGLEGVATMVVGDDDTAIAMRSGSLPVLATPRMAALAEEAASRAVAPFLGTGWSTVGTALDLSHSAPSPLGARVSCTARVEEVDGRRIAFSFSVRDDAGEVGSGTHERFLVLEEKFMSRAESRLRPR